MKRVDLEHILRAAASVTNHNDIVVIGSQSILGSYPAAPAALLVSAEADIYVRDAPHLSDLIDGTLGELSPFHETFGYYAQGVEEATAVLPSGWRERLVPVCNPNTRGATGWCLEPHDLAIAKLIAGRPKDLEYVRIAAEHELLQADTLLKRLAATSVAAQELRSLVAARITRLAEVE